MFHISGDRENLQDLILVGLYILKHGKTIWSVHMYFSSMKTHSLLNSLASFPISGDQQVLSFLLEKTGGPGGVQTRTQQAILESEARCTNCYTMLLA